MELLKITDNDEIKKYIGLLYSELFGQDAIPTDEVFDDIFFQMEDSRINHEAYCIKENNETIAFFYVRGVVFNFCTRQLWDY